SDSFYHLSSNPAFQPLFTSASAAAAGLLADGRQHQQQQQLYSTQLMSDLMCRNYSAMGFPATLAAAAAAAAASFSAASQQQFKSLAEKLLIANRTALEQSRKENYKLTSFSIAELQ